MRDIFKRLNDAYTNNDFGTIFKDPLGNLFLKLRSLSRGELLRQFAGEVGLNIEGLRGRQLFEYIFTQNLSEQSLNSFIERVYAIEREKRRTNEEILYSQLYQLQNFNWGGFYQNAVEQTIVNNYVKKIADYDELLSRIETDLNPRLKGYILCSWYNHWTSIIIEDIFKDHPTILPTIGLVKKVDFFWNDFPFDLKVTYFPDGFMKLKRQQRGLRPELTELKAYARTHNIAINRNLGDDDLFRELLTRIEESTSDEAKFFISEFNRHRREIIDETIANPQELIVWFYENQGTRRFDAANRFFLVLIDRNNLENSWKLKRNRDILQSGITDYLNDNQNIDFNQLRLSFNWEGNRYNSYATCLFLSRD
jgi:hypothetical protein